MIAEPVNALVGQNGSGVGVMNSPKQSRTEDRTVNDLVGRLAPDAIGHGVSNMLSNPNPTVKCLSGFRWEGRIVNLVADRLHP